MLVSGDGRALVRVPADVIGTARPDIIELRARAAVTRGEAYRGWLVLSLGGQPTALPFSLCPSPFAIYYTAS